MKKKEEKMTHAATEENVEADRATFCICLPCYTCTGPLRPRRGACVGGCVCNHATAERKSAFKKKSGEQKMIHL